MNICKNCRYWGRNEYDTSRDDWMICRHPKSLAYITPYSTYETVDEVEVNKDYGCVLYQGKNAKKYI